MTNIKKYFLSTIYCVVAILITHSNVYSQFTLLSDFSEPGAYTGHKPQYDQNLLLVDSLLYGMTWMGGAYGKGCIFRIRHDGSGHTMLFHFDGENTGSNPLGSLIYDGTYFYSTTEQGGSNNLGTIFRIKPDGSAYMKLFEFNGTNGSAPWTTLTTDGAYLYGTTVFGGVHDSGTLFRIAKDGTNFETLLEFEGETTGSYPRTALLYDGSSLYGVTILGGAHFKGSIFKIQPDGSAFSILHSFDDNSDGIRPIGALYADGTTLYGTASEGGQNNGGTIYKISKDGSGYQTIFDFTDSENYGNAPISTLISDGTSLYGMTYYGGLWDVGTIFKVAKDGSQFSKLYTFTDMPDGSYPNGSLIWYQDTLMAMTTYGGIHFEGTIFSILPDGSEYSKRFEFLHWLHGRRPEGSLYYDGSSLFGMTEYGGLLDDGVIFKIIPDGSNFNLLMEFDDVNSGRLPRNTFVPINGSLYGTAASGGINDSGLLFKIEPDGTGFTKLFEFDDSTNGTFIVCNVLPFGDYLYGMASYGGLHNVGTMFRVLPDGTDFTKILDFDNDVFPGEPAGSFITDGTYLYATTWRTGTYGKGTLFRIRPDGTDYTRIIEFEGETNGSFPQGDMFYDGTWLYGMTRNGGVYDYGTIFKLRPDGSDYVKLLDFDGLTYGRHPQGAFIQEGPYLYGMTTRGGSQDDGTIFKILPDGTGFTRMYDFDRDSSGLEPRGSLVSDGNYLYGMTYYGGTQGAGTVFRFGHCTYASQQSFALCAGESITIGSNTYSESGTYYEIFQVGNGCDSVVTTMITVADDIDTSLTINESVITSNAPGSMYQWIDCDNGGSIIAGETQQSFTATASGIYAVIVTSNGCVDTSTCVNIIISAIDQQGTMKMNLLQVSPNPGKGLFTIQVSDVEQPLQIEVIDELGKLVYQAEISERSFIIDLTSYPPGPYVIQVKTAQGLLSNKVILVR